MWRRSSRLLWHHLRTTAVSRGQTRSYSPSGELMRNGLKTYLSRMLDQYSSLVQKANSPDVHLLSEEEHRKLFRALSDLEPVARLVKQLEEKQKEFKELRQLAGDSEMRELAQEEEQLCRREIEQLEVSLMKALIPRDVADDHSAILEVRAGAGGQEASLFTSEVFHMYQRFAAHRHWQFEALAVDRSDTGGYRHASASLSGRGVYGLMKYESGVHRVQRIPVTEGHDRMHTSTMSVVILPQPTEVEVEINANDIKVETFKSGGPGGQSVNVTDSAVRMTHLPTGMVINMQNERSQHRNRAKALQLLRARVYEARRQEVEEDRSEQRRQQIGTLERFERIRTYNFPQDRVTDHRLGRTVHGVREFLTGSVVLEDVIVELQAQDEAKALTRLCSSSSSDKS